MSTGFIQEVTIVGGGTAGWLTAAFLNAKLNRPGSGHRVQIVLIESPTVPVIGVGEGTLPSMAAVLRDIGIDERDFFRACNASFKYGVRFEHWNLNERGIPYSFIHPFGAFARDVDGVMPIYHFLAFGAHSGRARSDVGDSLTAGTELIRLQRAPRIPSEADFSHIEPARYGYHVDAPKLAAFVRDFAVARGVAHILDDVDEAIVDQSGHISQLRLRRQGLRSVELVIDCTGFQSLLLGKLLGEPFVPYDQYLLCDRAIPIQIPHVEGEPLQVCTTATAMSAGWIWKVPLYNRIGTGYVFSSKFQTDEEAVREICRHLALDPEKIDPRIIRMRVGRMRRAWVGNCIAIGLSGGFIEPLEATAIHTITIAANQLVKNFPSKPIPQPLVDRFNRRLEACYETIRDFIVSHYYASNRTEPFWQAARSPSVLSEVLKQNFETWRYRLPDSDDLPTTILFSAESFALCLASKGYFNGLDMTARVAALRESWTNYGQHIERQRLAVRKMPLAREFLAQVRQQDGETTIQPQRPLAAEKSMGALPKQALTSKTLLARSRITFEELL